MTMTIFTNMKLPSDTAKEFSIATKLRGGPMFNFGKYGDIDFTKLNIKRARLLVASGFPHLKKKTKKAE